MVSWLYKVIFKVAKLSKVSLRQEKQAVTWIMHSTSRSRGSAPGQKILKKKCVLDKFWQ